MVFDWWDICLDTIWHDVDQDTKVKLVTNLTKENLQYPCVQEH